MRDFWRAIKFASIYKKLTLGLFFVVMTSVLFDLVQPQIFKLFLDLIGDQIKDPLPFSEISDSFYFYLGLFIATLTGQTILQQLSNYISSVWTAKTKVKLIQQVFEHVENLSLSFFQKTPIGKIKEKTEKGVEELQDIAEGVFYDILPQFAYMAVAIYFLFRINVLFGAVLLIGIPLFVIISLVFMRKLNSYQDDFRTSQENASGIVVETYANIKTVKSFVAEIKHARDLRKQLKISQDNSIKRAQIWVIMNLFRYIVVNTAQVIIIGFGLYWALTGKITLGTFTLAWQYTNRSFYPLWYLVRLFDRIQRNMRSVKRTFEVLDTEPEVTDIPGAKELVITKGEIEFRDVDFKYEEVEGQTEQGVLKDFSVKIPQRKTIAFVGKSGVGKSTLVKLLLRFHDLDKGEITIDGQNIKEVTQKSLRPTIGVVMQDSSLFNDTVFTNIVYGRPGATESEVIKAAKAANAHDFIMKLPKGYQTIIGEKGIKLSGGEQQRINIARALLKDPPILVLDEATSSLDSESEKLIQDALWKLIKGRTTIIIAHRLSTVMRADLIVVMDKGKISEMDTHKQLIKNEGIYSKLFKIQSGGYLQ